MGWWDVVVGYGQGPMSLPPWRSRWWPLPLRLISPRQVVGQLAQLLPTHISHLQGSSRDPKLFCYIDSSLGMRCDACGLCVSETLGRQTKEMERWTSQ